MSSGNRKECNEVCCSDENPGFGNPKAYFFDPEHNMASENSPDMKVDPQRASQLIEQLSSVQQRMSAVAAKSLRPSKAPVRLVAVSKLKPATDILALHSPPASHLHFGENYVQELLEKSRLLPPEIRWHFIGTLQSNKCQVLARDVRGLWAVESVDSVKKAKLLDKGRGERRLNNGSGTDGVAGVEPLKVFVQVNTSGEKSKSGVEPDSKELIELSIFIRVMCPNLRLQGLMTIGALARSQATTTETENPDFAILRETREKLAGRLGIAELELELSMGMSEDFEGAILMGSDEVRIGSTIFGQRPPKNEAKIQQGAMGESQAI
jgi:pyridoxal phosphate enzyme (YggS family)